MKKIINTDCAPGNRTVFTRCCKGEYDLCIRTAANQSKEWRH